MIETLQTLLLRLSEAGGRSSLFGLTGKPFFGLEFERLLARRVLVEHERLEVWPACTACDCEWGERPIQVVAGKFVAVCPTYAEQNVALDADDVRTFEIDRTNLVREVASACSVTVSPVELLPDVWLITTLPGGEVVILVLLRAAVLDPFLIPALRARVPRGLGVILTPAELPSVVAHQLNDAGFRALATSSVLKSNWSIDFDSLRASAATSPRLLIRQAAKSVELDGMVIPLPDQPFRTLLLLAQAVLDGRVSVEKRQLEIHLWHNLRMPDSRDVRDIIRDVRTAFQGLGNAGAHRGLIETKRGPTRYRLVLEAEEVSIGP